MTRSMPLLLVVALLFSGVASATTTVGKAPPMLGLNIIAGENAGKTLCVVHDRGKHPYLVVFVTKTNSMVEKFIKDFDTYVASLHGKGLRGFVVLHGAAAKQTKWGKDVYAKNKLKQTSLVTTRLAAEVKAWGPNSKYQTNAWFVNKGVVAKQWTAQCPCCSNMMKNIRSTASQAVSG